MTADAAKFARPYAVAAHRHASSAGATEWWESALQVFAKVLEDPELDAAMADPRCSEARDRRIIGDLLDRLLDGKNEQNDAFRRFADQLIVHRRLKAAPEIARLFNQLRREAEGVLHAEIRTTIELDQRRIDLIADKLKQRFAKKEVVTTVVTDPAIIGGIMIIAGDDVIDSSVVNRISQLRSVLHNN